MTTNPPLTPAVPATLGDVLELIDGRTDLPGWLRRDLDSAIHRFCRALDQAPTSVPADPIVLRRHMKNISAAMAGVSPLTWRNIKSLINRALAVAGIASEPGRSKAHLSPEWSELLSRIPDRGSSYRLSRMARHCSAQGVGPKMVDAEVMAGFARDLLQDNRVSRPKQIHRAACLAWNDCVDAVPGWPGQKVMVPNNRRDYSLDWCAFPESLRIEVDAYIEHLAGNDLLAETATHPASPVTINFRRIQLRQLASALAESGREPGTIGSLADLVSVGAAKAILSFFLKRRDKRKTGQIHNFALLLVNIAKHWVKVGPEQLELLQKLRRNVDPGKKGLTDKSRARLRQFDDPQNVERLVQLPEQIAEDLRGKDRGGVADALRMQSAVALAILLVAPLRVKNLARLNLEYHITRSRPGRGGKVHLVIPAHEVKNKVALEFELPPDVVAILDCYIETYRPRLVESPNPWLFPAQSGGPKPPGPFGTQLSQTIRQATGLVMNVHLFRHLAAQLILEANPGAYEIVRLVLGHVSGVTTTTFYCGSEQKAAFRLYDSIISRFRKPDGDDNDQK